MKLRTIAQIAALGTLLIAIAPTAAHAQQQQVVGNVVYEHYSDPMSGVVKDYIGVPSMDFNAGSGAAFFVRCNGLSDFDAYVVFSNTYLNQGSISIQWRIDSRPAQGPINWDASTDGTGAFAPEGVKGSLISDLLGASYLTLAAFDYNDTRYIEKFDLNGFSAALHMLPCFKAP